MSVYVGVLFSGQKPSKDFLNPTPLVKLNSPTGHFDAGGRDLTDPEAADAKTDGRGNAHAQYKLRGHYPALRNLLLKGELNGTKMSMKTKNIPVVSVGLIRTVLGLHANFCTRMPLPYSEQIFWAFTFDLKLGRNKRIITNHPSLRKTKWRSRGTSTTRS